MERPHSRRENSSADLAGRIDLGVLQNLKQDLNMFKRENVPQSSVGKESACNMGDLVSIPGLGRSPGEEKGYPPQYSSLQNSAELGMTFTFSANKSILEP